MAEHLKFAQAVKGPGPGVVIVGMGALNEADGAAVLAHAMAIAAAQDAKLLVLHTAAGRVGAMDVGTVTEGGLAAATDGAEVIFNLGADEVDIAAGPFVIYQGSHGDRGANRADIILPGAAYTEENGLFVNTEGRPQLALRAGFAPGEAKENWAVLRALSAELGATLPWDTQAALRARLVADVPHVAQQVHDRVLALAHRRKGRSALAFAAAFIPAPYQGQPFGCSHAGQHRWWAYDQGR